MLCQSKVGHIRFGLHRGRCLNPVNEVLGIVRKFARNIGATRHFVERRTDYTIGAVNAGNHVARTAPELFYDRPSTLRRSGRMNAVSGKFLAPVTSGEPTDGGNRQARDDQSSVHRFLRCGQATQSVPQKRATESGVLISFCDEMLKGNGRKRSRRVAIRGMIVAAFLASACQANLAQKAGPSFPDGKQIFSEYCAKCHGEHGEGVSAAVSYMGPSLQAEHNAGLVMAAVEVGPEHMPRFEYVLSGDQMRAVSQYVAQKLAVIPLTGGNVSEGGELYRTYCATCHRTDVRGGALGFVGTNAPSLENTSVAMVAGAIRWGPGPMPSFPPSVLDDQQVASIVDYVAAVQHPASPGGSPMGWYGPVAEGFAAWVMVLVLILFAMWAERGGHG